MSVDVKIDRRSLDAKVTSVKISFAEKISRDEIIAVAKRLLGSQPAVAARGDLRRMPSLEYVQAGLIDADGKMPSGRKLSLFR
jgi:processing peptidase subunit alpha